MCKLRLSDTGKESIAVLIVILITLAVIIALGYGVVNFIHPIITFKKLQMPPVVDYTFQGALVVGGMLTLGLIGWQFYRLGMFIKSWFVCENEL